MIIFSVLTENGNTRHEQDNLGRTDLNLPCICFPFVYVILLRHQVPHQTHRRVNNLQEDKHQTCGSQRLPLQRNTEDSCMKSSNEKTVYN